MSGRSYSLAAASIAFGVLAGSCSVSYAMSNQAFLKSAIEGDNSEVQLGLMAERNGASAAVRNFGKTLEGDHAQARIQAVRLANMAGMTAPTSATAEAKAEMSKLRGLSGSRFDKAFADYMIEDHQKDISEFQSEARSSAGPVARFARMSIPTLEKHLHMAQSIARSAS